MAPSDRQWLGLLAHELNRPLARLGSEAELVAAEAVEELRRAYGPGQEYREAEARILARRDRMRIARSAVASVLRLAPLAARSADADVSLNLAPTRLIELVLEVVEQMSSDFVHPELRLSSSDDRIKVTCDAGLMQICLSNVLARAAVDMGPRGIEIQLGREAGEAVISMLCLDPANRLPKSRNEWLPEIVTKSILDLHGGRLEEDDGDPRITRLRLPLGLAPGRRLVPLRRRD